MTRFIWLVVGSLLLGTAHAGEVIVNSQLEQQNLPRALLRGVFGMRVRVWPDGTPVRVFVLSSSAPEHIEFCKQVLRMYPYQLEQAWDRLVYSGTGQRPTLVPDTQQMRELVANTPGAVGYLAQGATAKNPTDGIRVLHVD